MLPLFKPSLQSPRGSIEAPGIVDIYWLTPSMGCRSISDLFEPLHPKQANVLVLFIFEIEPVFIDLKINIQSRTYAFRNEGIDFCAVLISDKKENCKKCQISSLNLN